jgi:hypothetical protein
VNNLKPGTVIDSEIRRIYTRDLNNPKLPRTYRWPEYFEESGYVGVNGKDSEYKTFVMRVTETLTDLPDGDAWRKLNYCQVKAVVLTDDEIMATEFRKHICAGYRYSHIQADLFKINGYDGPVPGGTARGLINAFNAIGKPECVRRGYFNVERKVTLSYGYNYYRTRRTYCYVFKSPRPDLTLKDFVRLARAYRDGKGLAKAVKAVIEAKGDDFATTLETLTTLDTLAGLGE